MKKILIALIALLSIGFIKQSEASTGILLIKKTASFLTINKVLHQAVSLPSCGIKGCEFPGDHDAKHENQKYPRPFLWDVDSERYREATADETAAINGSSDVNFPEIDEEEIEIVETEIEEEKEEEEVEEEKGEDDDIDDFFKDTFGDGDDEEEDEDYEDEENDKEPTAEPVDYDEDIYEDIDEEEAEDYEEDDNDSSDEDDYFDDQDGESDDTEAGNDDTREEDMEDLDISDWGIKLKEQLEEKIEKEVEKADRKIDKEIEKLRKKRKRKTSTDNKDI